MNFFEFFGLERKLNVDLADLERRFYSLSRQWHPDRFARAGDRERQEALDASAILNDGYRTLRDPVARAEYLLTENGFDIQSSSAPPELLEEVFELNMALEELRQGDDEGRSMAVAARERFLAMRQEVDTELAEQFAAYDAEPGRPKLEKIRGILNRRRYIRNLINEVEKALAAR